jgi:transcriptional regulator with XRE-family HTH domain
VTGCDWHYVGVIEHLVDLGARVTAARIAKRWSVETAARQAEISRTTWNRVESGLGVQDVKRAAVLDVLGLDSQGRPVETHVRHDSSYVTAPGETSSVREGDDEVLRAIRSMQEDIRIMSERLARLEQQVPPPAGPIT